MMIKGLPIPFPEWTQSFFHRYTVHIIPLTIEITLPQEIEMNQYKYIVYAQSKIFTV